MRNPNLLNSTTFFLIIPLFLSSLFLYMAYEKIVNFNLSDKNEVEAKIIGQDSKSWHFKTLRTAENLENPFFVDQNIGFASNSEKFTTSFYKSTDGGNSWNKTSTIKDYYVNNLFFYTPAEGFALVFNVSPLQSKNSDKYSIMKTNDGGTTWNKVISSSINSFNKIIINTNGLGVVVGRKSPSNFAAENLVLLTTDFGKTWSESSESLNDLVKNTDGQVSDYLADGIISNNKIIVLSICGRVFQTSNLGNSWELVSKLTNEPAQTLIQHFGSLENGEFWMSGGAVSGEGKWGIICINKSKLTWERYRLNGYYFSDVKFLTNNEIIAVGSLTSPDNLGGIYEKDIGVILYSTDRGKSWSVIHSDTSSNLFNSVINLTEQKFYVVGNNGIKGILEKKTD